MAVRAKGANLAIALLLIILGVLVLVGRLGIGPLIPLLGLVLIVVGILMLVNVLAGGRLWGIVALVLGLALQLDYLGIPRAVSEVLNIVIGVLLIVFGVLRLVGK